LDGFQRDLIGLLPRLRRFARALTRDSAEADDLVQKAVELGLRRRGQWQEGSRLDSWMYTVMKNAWIDETRARARQGRLFRPAEEGEAVADPYVPDLEIRLAAASVEQAMANLPDEQRAAVALVLVEGLSYREAADILEVPMGTLTSRLVRGRAALQAMLSDRAGGS
jgi:RNA polymerase sigma factor (sigma-70 family)